MTLNILAGESKSSIRRHVYAYTDIIVLQIPTFIMRLINQLRLFYGSGTSFIARI